MRVLLVEDDAKLATAVQRGLRHEGNVADVATTGEEALSQAATVEYDAIVLDLMLPDIDGFAVCEALRQREQWTPVLMLTARGDVEDRIRGLDIGADDYLVKPFDFGELLARLRVLTRRGPSGHAPVLKVGDIHLNSASRVVSVGGQQIELTQREIDVLEMLMRNAGRVVTRDELLTAVWAHDYRGAPNIADIYIGYLRRKLEHRKGRQLIRTIRGKGFLLERP